MESLCWSSDLSWCIALHRLKSELQQNNSQTISPPARIGERKISPAVPVLRTILFLSFLRSSYANAVLAKTIATRLYAGRVVGRHRHHRHPGQLTAARYPKGAPSRVTLGVH